MLRRLLFRNLKFVYRISQWNKHRLTPAGLLVVGVTVAAGIFGVDVRQSMAFQVFSLGVSLLLVATAGVLVFRARFRLLRLLPEYGTVGVVMRYRLQIENLGTQEQSELLLFDELQTDLPTFDEFTDSDDPEDRKRNRFDRIIGYPRLLNLIRRRRGAVIEATPLERIAGNGRADINIDLLPLRRGHIQFALASICRNDPLGLMRAIKKYRRIDKLLILPKTYRPPRIELRGLRKYHRGGMQQASTVGDSQEFMSLRDYRPGDPLRAIHWRSYARTGHPVVKEFHDEFFVRHGLLLDTFQEHTATSVFEEAVSLAASFCLTLPAEDALLDLLFVSDTARRFTSGRGLGRREGLLETLACVQACSGNPFASLRDLVAEFAGETSGMICVLLCWDDKRRQLVDYIIRLGIPVIAFVLVEAEETAPLEPGPLSRHPERLVPLSCAHMQRDLDRQDSFGLAKE